VSVAALSASITVVASLLALGAGAAKLRSPRTAVVAMRAVGLPSSDALVRLGSLIECAIAGLALASPPWIARVLLALSYGALAAFVAVAVRTGAAVDCGCFGTVGGAVGRRHLTLNLVVCLGVGASLLTHPGATTAAARPATAGGLGVLAVGVVSALLAATFVSREGAS
jgi:hypothetical protein